MKHKTTGLRMVWIHCKIYKTLYIKDMLPDLSIIAWSNKIDKFFVDFIPKISGLRLFQLKITLYYLKSQSWMQLLKYK